MKQIDYKTLIENINIYEKEIYRIFNKLLKEDLKANTQILSYGSYSAFERVDWHSLDETNVSVIYYDDGYDLYDSSDINIPTSILFNDEEINKWIQGRISDELILISERQKKAELEKEAKERAEYERLAKKYNDNKN